MMYRNALVRLSLHFCPKTGVRIGMGILSRRLTGIVDGFERNSLPCKWCRTVHI